MLLRLGPRRTIFRDPLMESPTRLSVSRPTLAAALSASRTTILGAAMGGAAGGLVADVAVGGKLASLGNRLIGATAQKLTDAFFANLSDALTPPEEARSA